MTIRVFSEIGRLQRVLIHRPGFEIDRMVPSMMERLLFDDILYGQQARSEHDSFRKVLEAAGVETLDPETLLAEVLEQEDVRGQLFADLERRFAVRRQLMERLERLAPKELAVAMIAGVPAAPDDRSRPRRFFELPPVPNYFFQRDPQVVFGTRVLLSSMATDARAREPMLARRVFADHPALQGYEDLFDLNEPGEPGMRRRPHLEGGDVLVPSDEILMVGLSERTDHQGIEALARYLKRSETAFRYLLVVELPAQRSYMHLDTVFTFIDEGLCLAYPPVIEPGGTEAGHVYRIDLEAPHLAYRVCDNLPSALAELGMEIELVPCGGKDLIDQQREQWTDGANAFAIAPGVIAIYRRNRRTAEELSRRGWRVIEGEAVIDGREELFGHGPTLVTLFDNELSRARGGPRCMTMPLERAPV